MLVTGSALSLGLSLLWIGVFLMMAMVLCIWSLALLERVLSRFLLGEPLRATPRWSESDTPWQRFRSILKDPSTSKGGLFLLLKFPIGLASFVVSVVAFSISAAFICAPVNEYGGEIDFGYRTVQDPTGGWLIAIVGILLLFVTLHMHNLLGFLWKMMARYLLGTPGAPSESGQAQPPAPLVGQELQTA